MILSGSFLPQSFTMIPPSLFTSSANISFISAQRSAKVEYTPVLETVVPQTIGSSHEPTLAAAGVAAARAAASATAVVYRIMWGSLLRRLVYCQLGEGHCSLPVAFSARHT